jgi:hypothetical protein
MLKKPYPLPRINNAVWLMAIISPLTLSLRQSFVAITVHVTVTLKCSRFVDYTFYNAHLLIVY